MTTKSSPTPTFEFFQGTLSESTATARVTVRRGGLVVVSRAAADMIGDGVTHVQLAYDPKTGVVGLRKVDAGAPGAYLLRKQAKSPSRLVSGKRFFQHYDLEVEKARTFDVEDFGNGVVGFQFSEAAASEASKKPTSRKTKAAT